MSTAGAPPLPATDERVIRFRARVELIATDLMAVLTRHWPSAGHQLIAHALLETTGSVLGAIVQADPTCRPDLEAKLADLRLFVQATPPIDDSAKARN